MQAPETTDAPVDLNRLREVADDDADFMNELISLYLQQTAEFLDTLKNAVAEKDFETIRKIAHKALGGSATCGMTAIIQSLKMLEQSGESKNPENAEKALEQSQTAFEEIRAFLENHTKHA